MTTYFEDSEIGVIKKDGTKLSYAGVSLDQDHDLGLSSGQISSELAEGAKAEG